MTNFQFLLPEFKPLYEPAKAAEQLVYSDPQPARAAESACYGHMSSCPK